MNGAFYDFVSASAERHVLGPLREELLCNLRGEIVELGGGTGANFRYYNRDAHVVVAEPDSSMAHRAETRLALSRARIELRAIDDSLLDSLAERSVDAVVLTLVLCSVDDPIVTLKRAERVLNEHGNLVLIEHIRSTGSFGKCQDIIAPVWRWATRGCHLNRDAGAALLAAGFDSSTLRVKTLGGVTPIRALIYGRCRAASRTTPKPDV